MFLIELALHDPPERLAARAAHRDRLAALHEQGVVRIAGPTEAGDRAYIVVDGDRSVVDAVLADDPYYSRDDVEVLQVIAWAPVFR